MEPIGWKADAEIICAECASARYGDALDDPDTRDSEGNELWPVFEYEEGVLDDACHNCLESLADIAGIVMS